ncbi:MAG: YnfA family protein [Xanthomonadaceae bacterium]|nr:YnfA family protein [Xanthomonadaceae bacterium]
MWYLLAAVAEIGGCFMFWVWLRGDGSAWWAVPGVAVLALFAWFLTQVDAQFAGRAFAAYGGIYIASSLVWLRWIEGERLIGTDLLGALLCLAGAAVILYGPTITR